MNMKSMGFSAFGETGADAEMSRSDMVFQQMMEQRYGSKERAVVAG